MRPFALIPFILLRLLLSASAQSDPGELLGNAMNRRFMTRHDTLYAFYAVSPDPDRPLKANPDKTYFWFRKDSIFTTKGDYAGRLLHGEYKVFYPDKSLRESGNFHYGLRVGEWKTWYPDGSLQSITWWKKGEETGHETNAPPK
ncbi:MAG TPA: hypothetical protein VNW04_23580 [Puia sp.]|nr:hypothetical protein [Puia sp.]